MEQTKKKVNVLAIVSASIGLFAAIFGFIFGGESLAELTIEGDYISPFKFMSMYLQGGEDGLLIGILDLMVIISMVVVLVGSVLGLVGAILGKTGLLRAGKILGVVAIPVVTVFAWSQMTIWLASTEILLTGTFIFWLLSLAFSITMMISYSKALKAEKAAA